MQNPCNRECPTRSSECHSTCEKYKKWKAEHEEQRYRDRLAHVDRPSLRGTWVRNNDGYWRSYDNRRKR